MGTVKILREEARRQLTDDYNFVKKMLYYFELRAPKKLASRVANKTGVFFFPLILNPTSATTEEPFTIEVTPTQGGGLYVEENGIVQRILRLKGHTGFKPRRFTGAANTSSVELVEDKSYSRMLAPFVLDALSGQKHFQYLQDAVFRTYGDLKRDPDSSEDTKLFFHNPKDSESWEVKPQKFALNREAGKRVLYEYDIELLIVGKADAVDADFSEDKAWLDEARDAIAAAKAYADLATGFVNDVSATVAELSRWVKDIATIVSSIGELADAATALVEGVTDLIESPLAVVNALTDAVDSVSNLLVTTVSEFKSIPDNYTNTWRRMSQALDRLATHPELFETDAQRTLRKIKEDQDKRTAAARAQANQDAGATNPDTIAGFGEIGTEPLLGEIDRARAELNAGRDVNQYTAAQEITVSQGDTLAGLAAQYLGDARLWQDIALLNGMKPPYIDAQADASLAGPANPIPGVSGIGAKIVVPTFGRAPEARALLSTLGVSREASFEDQVLGTDYLLEPTNERKDQFDWVIDTNRGSTDFQKVSGRNNLTQGTTTRLSTQKGTNVLYKQLGLQRVIGISQTDVDTQLARFMLLSAIAADPRIAAVQRLQFTDEGADVLGVDADLAVRGFSQGVAVKAIGVGS